MENTVTNRINFREVFEALPFGLLILKPNAPHYTVLEANETFLNISGRQRAEIINKDLFEVLSNDAAESKVRLIRNLKLSLETVVLEKKPHSAAIQKYDLVNAETGRKEERYWLPKNTPFLDETGEISYIIHHLEDVTEMKIFEKQQQTELEEYAKKLIHANEELEIVNKELDDFSYSVSHDLRAPLRAVDGYSRMIIEDYGDKIEEEGKHYLNTVILNAERMGALIDDLLSFCRVGKQNVSRVVLNMNSITEAVVSELKQLPYGQATAINMDSLSPVEGDSSMIRQVMAHLVANAVKFSQKMEKPLVEIGCTKQEDKIIYYVKDNGVGFDMKYYDKLFGVFQRLHGKNEFEGTGVGLALVHRIIKKHGGEIWGESKINEGAVFYFSLPVRAISDRK